MEIKNKVILRLDNGLKKEFNSTCSLDKIKSKYSIGSLFICSQLPFVVGVIESMTTNSIIDHKKKEKKEIEKNMKSIRNLLK